jgi:hypothetical protein
MGQFQLGRIHDGFPKRIPARYADGLGAVMGFPSTGAAGAASLCTAGILGPGQFVSGEVNDVVLGAGKRFVRL